MCICVNWCAHIVLQLSLLRELEIMMLRNDNTLSTQVLFLNALTNKKETRVI
jgi:hypothetical protein